ncbi:uncharacterized protein E5676_scaffold703G00100 [Cucumis melo var. makuwa]|uniref:Uncharacterized protein n=1 Tax=Cucumis melo var. makuwa TaxID=1194695 RepID=A0A5D3BJC8_CUCMM|nr:uncharacterized protein E6C27_scaffold845G00210 [Cucumis melo var. makuwa]TYJ98811.1 uncharacterized protein E5676_scaffold703G00100 [Cucumis melo var. makuwa]
MGYVLGHLPICYLGLPLLSVDNILRSYPWMGKEEGRGGVKVAWGEFGFSVGGLGEAYILKGRSLWLMDSEVGR